jgi:Na+/phosphate symporter
MTDPVHEIGITELYQEIRHLSDKLTDYVNRQDREQVSLTHRMAEVEKDQTEMRAQIQAEHLRRMAAKHQAWIATWTALIFPVVVAVVLALVLNKG